MSEQPVEVRFQRLPEGRDLAPPQRASPGAAGFDLRARVDGAVELAPGERRLVPTGLAVAIPAGYEAQVRPRSGLAVRSGLTLVNSPGTIDSDYRGEIQVVLINLGQVPVRVERGERIAQMIVQRVPEVELVEAAELAPTARGAGGFGHTGRR